jgi:hypothetical protein
LTDALVGTIISPAADGYITRLEKTRSQVDWDLVFDARGHFAEPHEGVVVNLGTLAVRNYLNEIREAKLEDPELNVAGISTYGPDRNFAAVLFIEKEGFQPLFERVKVAERHDVAIMSTKGVLVTAARLLVDRLCSAYDVPLLVLHDFDVASFTILDTLRRDTRRYRFESDIKVIDLGLRRADVRAMGLQSEDAASSKSGPGTIRARLRNSGATPEECDFLVHQRVELNAMTSERLVTLIGRKLAEHGIKKIIPVKETFDEAYRLFDRGRCLRDAYDKARTQVDTTHVSAPNDIEKRVAKILKDRPTLRWDAAVKEVHAEYTDEDDG